LIATKGYRRNIKHKLCFEPTDNDNLWSFNMSSEPKFEYNKKNFIEIVNSFGIPFKEPYISDLRVSFKVNAEQPNRIVLLKEGNKISIVFHLAKEEKEIKNSYTRRNGFIAKYITDVESEKSTIFEYLQKHENTIRSELD
jgi:hypothetical protein